MVGTCTKDLGIWEITARFPSLWCICCGNTVQSLWLVFIGLAEPLSLGSLLRDTALFPTVLLYLGSRVQIPFGACPRLPNVTNLIQSVSNNDIEIKKPLPITLIILRVIHSLCKFILETKQGYTAVLNTVICLGESSCKAPANTLVKFRLKYAFHFLISKILS